MNSECDKQTGFLTLAHWFSARKALVVPHESQTGQYHQHQYLRTHASHHLDATATQLQGHLRAFIGTNVSDQTIRIRLHHYGLSSKWPLCYTLWMPGTAERICSGPGDMLVGPSSSGRQWCSLLRAGSPCIGMTVSNVLGGVGVCAMLCQHGPNTEAEPHRASLEWCVYAHTTMWPLGSQSCCGRRIEHHSANNIQHQVRSVSQRCFYLFFLFIYIYFLICFLQYHKSSHFRYTINFIINKNCIFGIQALAPLTSSTCLCFPLLLTLVAFSLLSHYCVLQVVHTHS